jgi:hypothetical protein
MNRAGRRAVVLAAAGSCCVAAVIAHDAHKLGPAKSPFLLSPTQLCDNNGSCIDGGTDSTGRQAPAPASPGGCFDDCTPSNTGNTGNTGTGDTGNTGDTGSGPTPAEAPRTTSTIPPETATTQIVTTTTISGTGSNGCTLTAEGNCIKDGESCSTADHGQSAIGASGETLTCIQDTNSSHNFWRWWGTSG